MTDFLIQDFVSRPHRLHLIGRGRYRHDPAALSACSPGAAIYIRNSPGR
jgi:hypothetical protein